MHEHTAALAIHSVYSNLNYCLLLLVLLLLLHHTAQIAERADQAASREQAVNICRHVSISRSPGRHGQQQSKTTAHKQW
jgi:hypothetical protein